jgi:hypothetical protein
MLNDASTVAYWLPIAQVLFTLEVAIAMGILWLLRRRDTQNQ